MKFISRLTFVSKKEKDIDRLHSCAIATAPSSTSVSTDNEDSYKTTFQYTKDVCALSWWEPIRLLEEGSISDIHLVRRRDQFVKVRYKDKRDVMSLAKKQSGKTTATTTNEDDEVYVLKSIMKDHIGNDLVLDEMRQEIHTMSKLNHPNICRLIEAYERRRHIYLVMEFCKGGNLASRMPMKEKEAAAVCKKILSAVEYLHGKGLAHRDIKLENIMFDGKGEIKLIDFGLATAYLNEDYKHMTDKVGTLYSMAPQVLAGDYDERCDLWSVGVVAYLLLSGNQPFWGTKKKMPWNERRKVMIDRIKKCEYAPMTTTAWGNVSQLAKNFVQSLLQMNPDDRPSAKEALDSEWIKSADEVGEKKCDCGDNDVACHLQFELKASLRRRLWRLLSTKLSEDEILGLRAYLEVQDDTGDGLISVGDLQTFLEDVSKSIEGLSKDDVHSVFAADANGELVEGTNVINYMDLMVEVIVGKGRNTFEAFAKAVDTLDTNGTRKVAATDLQAVLVSLFPSDIRDDILSDLEIDNDGLVNTISLLGNVAKRFARHNRDSIRSVNTKSSGSIDEA